MKWLSRGNGSKRFMELFDMFNDFPTDKWKIKSLSTTDGKAFVSYLKDIFWKIEYTIPRGKHDAC